jgi:hypothetical protein
LDQVSIADPENCISPPGHTARRGNKLISLKFDPKDGSAAPLLHEAVDPKDRGS